MPPKDRNKPAGTTSESRQYPLLNLSRKILLATVGAVALAQDEVEEFVDRLVERGEIAEKDGRSLVHEIMQKRKNVKEKFKHKAAERLSETFTQMDLPSRQDFENLRKKIDELNQKIDELKNS